MYPLGASSFSLNLTTLYQGQTNFLPPLILYTIRVIVEKVRNVTERVNFVANGVSAETPLSAAESPIRMAEVMHNRRNQKLIPFSSWLTSFFSGLIVVYSSISAPAPALLSFIFTSYLFLIGMVTLSSFPMLSAVPSLSPAGACLGSRFYFCSMISSLKLINNKNND